jgi:hypothetical protein
MRLRRVLGALAALGVLGTLRSLWRARSVPLSPLTADGRVGPDYPEREGIADGSAPAGEMDDMAAYARPDFDLDALHTEVRAFYERTSDYRMTYRARWHRGFRLGAALAGRFTERLEQLNLPGPGGDPRELESRFAGLDPAADPRDGARMWVRTDPDTGKGVFVAAYAGHAGEGGKLVNIAVPLPRSNLSTVLRPEELDCAHPEGAGIELTTEGGREGGLYLAVPPLAFSLPMGQRFRVWPADAPGAPAFGWAGREGAADGPLLVATHEMWILGVPFLTVEYAIRPEPDA